MKSFDILSKQTPLHHRLFLEASAGTGKTFTIEHLIVRLLLETDLVLEEILVVTFTRAATRELKNRIRNNLDKVFSSNDYNYLEGITSVQKEKIKNAFVTFDQAQIFTIHGFCLRILQEFAFEMEVGLELQEWDVRDEIWEIKQFLRKTEVLSPEELKRVLGFCRGDTDLLIQKLLESSDVRMSKTTLGNLKFFPVSDVFSEIRIHYKGLTSSNFDQQIAVFENALKRGYFVPEEWDYLIGEKEIFLEKLDPHNLKSKSTFPGHPEMIQLKETVLPSLEECRNPRHIFKTLAASWKEHRKNLSSIQEKISPDDLLKKVFDRLTDEAFVSAIRKKYRAIIVDEFQDTDPVQWEIFEKLFVDDEEKFVYLIGDPKQSIYGFRNADIYTFLRASHRFETSAMLLTNYRSTEGLLESLNRLFCSKDWLHLPRLDKKLEILPFKSAKKGDGTLCFMMVHGILESGKKWPSLSLERKYLFPFIVHEIERLKLNPSSVAVLVSDRYQALRLQQFLERWEVPSSLHRGSSLGDSLMVELLEELVQACFGDNTFSSIKKVLIGPLVGIPIDALSEEAVLEAKSFFSCLSEIWVSHGFSAFLVQFLQTYPLDPSFNDDLLQIVEKLESYQDPYQILKALKLLKVEEQKDRISAHPQGVQIMTVHASKGLEFDTVFALGVASRTTPDEDVEEQDAEKMRQFYVALTRAKTRLYIPLIVETSEKPYAWGEGSPMELFWKKASPDIRTFNHVFLNEMQFELHSYPKPEERVYKSPNIKPQFSPLFLQSFSSIAHPAVEKKVLPEDLLLPPGVETGIIVHTILERVFGKKGQLSELIIKETCGTHLEGYQTSLLALLEKVLELPLKGFCLRDIDPDKVISEMEFLFPTPTGAMKGFIDLCFEHEGIHYLIDWKTNALENYNLETLEKAMMEHAYHLQGKIYAEACRRYLKIYNNPPFGGVFFIFVRGPAAYHVS